MILVAHLFGTKMDMQPLVEFAAKHDLPLVEDCAQVYRAKEYRGHPQSDVSLFSFGPIKTATALGGGLLSFRNKQLADQVRVVTETWPTQSRWQFAKRVCKYMVLITLGTRFMYTIFAWCAKMLGKDHDKIIYASLRGFSGNFMTKIRHQPSIGLLRLLHRRTNDAGAAATASIISRRIEVAKEAIRCLTGIKRPGSETGSHSHWIFPILCATPEILDPLRNEMVAAGFDATRSATSLRVVEPPAGRAEVEPSRAREMLTRVLYIPIFEGVSPAEVQEMAAIVQRHNIVMTKHIVENDDEHSSRNSHAEKQTSLPSLTS
jgi:dTDP-4-amino-4,6-dideoxygalactose transaminase